MRKINASLPLSHATEAVLLTFTRFRLQRLIFD